MKNEKKTVLLIYGGKGKEHEISVRGAVFASKLFDREKYRVIPVYISREGKWFVRKNLPGATGVLRLARGECERIAVYPTCIEDGPALLGRGALIHTDCAIPLLHGDFGEDGVVQGALESAGIPYVGCSVKAGAVISDKGFTKLIARSLGIPTAEGIRVTNDESAASAVSRAEGALKYPMFVKPPSLGSSIGAARVTDRESLILAITTAQGLSDGLLIEECIDIEKELECGYFGTKCKEIFTKPGEISYDGQFYDYNTKYKSAYGVRISECAEVTDDISRKVIDISKKLCRELGVRHLSRIDFFLTKDSRLIFNEINSFPGFTENSLYPKLLKKAGIEPAELLNLLVEDTLDGGYNQNTPFEDAEASQGAVRLFNRVTKDFSDR